MQIEKTQTKKLTIIIVAYQSIGVIADCLSKINFAKYRVIIIDNNSGDDLEEILEKQFRQAELIKLTNNIGYGRANNIGLRKSVSDYALILNPDAFILEDDIEKVLKIMDENSDIALAGPLVESDYPITQQRKNEIRNAHKIDQDYLAVRFIIGGILFMNMKIMREIGFFDEEFFMFCEDNEICTRVEKHGYKNIIAVDCVGFHCGGGSSKKSLRNIYKRSWHLNWSKAKWRMGARGKFNALRLTLRAAGSALVRIVFYSFVFDRKKLVANFGALNGSLAFLVGLKAFREDGTARG